jgi:Peptidase family M3
MIHYVSSFNVVGSSRRRAHVLCQASSHHRISSAQRRFIISNLRELFWGGVGTTSADGNPIIDIIEQRQKPSISQETASDLAAPRMYLPKFSSIKPKHMAGAAHYIKDQQVQDLQRTTELVLPMEIPKATDGSIVNESLLDNLIRSVDRIHQSHFALSQIGSLLWSLSCVDMKTKNDWHCSLIEAQSISIDESALSAQILRDHEIHGADGSSKVITLQWNQLHHAIFAALQSPQKGNSQQSNVFAAKILLRKYEYATGILFPPSVATTSGENGPCYSDDDRARKYSELSEMLSDVEKSILEIDSAKVSLPTVRLFYSYIGVRTQMAKLLGYSTAADQVFRCRHQVSAVADIDLIKQLHLDVKERLTPMLNSISERRKRPLDLETYLTGAGELTSQANLQNSKYSIQYWKDTKAMLKLEHHVTLKGALQFTFRLMKDLFGVSIAEHDKDDLDVWNENVRLYHVYDELYQHEYMGSFYLDPFQRREKMSQPATMPIFPGCGEYENQRPLVCMSLALELPPWDTSPAMMTWLDCETLLHEMGHVMQFMMSRSHTGCVLGPQSMPLDISEFLPKVRVLLIYCFRFINSEHIVFSFSPRNSLWNCG